MSLRASPASCREKRRTRPTIAIRTSTANPSRKHWNKSGPTTTLAPPPSTTSRSPDPTLTLVEPHDPTTFPVPPRLIPPQPTGTLKPATLQLVSVMQTRIALSELSHNHPRCSHKPRDSHIERPHIPKQRHSKHNREPLVDNVDRLTNRRSYRSVTITQRRDNPSTERP